jgi:hypothetical protein
MSKEIQSEFEKIAREKPSANLLIELLSFLRHNKKWWLLPILIVLLAFGTLIILSGTAAAPFIYTLF